MEGKIMRVDFINFNLPTVKQSEGKKQEFGIKLNKPLQKDTVNFKSKNLLSPKDKALKNLLIIAAKQGLINDITKEFLLNEIKKDNIKVIKYINNINIDEDEKTTSRKAKAEKLVSIHSNLAGAIASADIEDNKKNIAYLLNQAKMVQGIREIYENNKELKLNSANGEIGFGGRKDKAMKIVDKCTNAVATIKCQRVLLERCSKFYNSTPIVDNIPLWLLETNMIHDIGEIYGVSSERMTEDKIKAFANNFIPEILNDLCINSKSVQEIIEKYVKNIISDLVVEKGKDVVKTASTVVISILFPAIAPVAGGIVDGIDACVDIYKIYTSTSNFGEELISAYQKETGHYD